MEFLTMLRSLFKKPSRKRSNSNLYVDDDDEEDDPIYVSAPTDAKNRRLENSLYGSRTGLRDTHLTTTNVGHTRFDTFQAPQIPNRPVIRDVPIRYELPNNQGYAKKVGSLFSTSPKYNSLHQPPQHKSMDRRKTQCNNVPFSSRAFDAAIQLTDDSDDEQNDNDVIWMEVKPQSSGRQNNEAMNKQVKTHTRRLPELRSIRGSMSPNNPIPDLYPIGNTRRSMQHATKQVNGFQAQNGSGSRRSSQCSSLNGAGFANSTAQKRFTAVDKFFNSVGVQPSGTRETSVSLRNGYDAPKTTTNNRFSSSNSMSASQYKTAEYESYNKMLVNQLMPSFAKQNVTRTSVGKENNTNNSSEMPNFKDTIELSDDEDTPKESLKDIPKMHSGTQRINTLLRSFEVRPTLQDNYLTKLSNRYLGNALQRKKDIEAEEKKSSAAMAETQNQEELLQRKLKEFMITSDTIVVDESEPELSDDEDEESIDDPLPPLSTADNAKIDRALHGGSGDEVLIKIFNIDMTRRDIQTLHNTVWLNDNVINMYMNLITERGKTKPGALKVYAMNTFFIPSLMGGGFSKVARWTRKVDLFAMDVIPVPVHVGNVHWCMAIIHIKNKTIRYYDSMGHSNMPVLKALTQYIKDESKDKKKCELDMSGWTMECVEDCPRQLNGSDCGVFSCMFAEYITRNRRISFTQDDMPYFRRKMILEICTGKLLM